MPFSLKPLSVPQHKHSQATSITYCHGKLEAGFYPHWWDGLFSGKLLIFTQFPANHPCLRSPDWLDAQVAELLPRARSCSASYTRWHGRTKFRHPQHCPMPNDALMCLASSFPCVLQKYLFIYLITWQNLIRINAEVLLEEARL